MRIVRHGKSYYKNHFFCERCDCEWYANDTEIEIGSVEDDEAVYYAATCDCPECGDHTVEVDWKDPKKIRK